MRRLGRVPKEFLEYRFDVVGQVVQAEGQRTREALGSSTGPADMVEHALREAAVLSGRQFRRSEAAADRLLAAVEAYEASRAAADAATTEQVRLSEEASALLARSSGIPSGSVDLTARDRQLLNYASSHAGYLAQAGLWFNPPLSLAMTEDGPELMDVNERIGEVPFVFAAMQGLPLGASVLDVGSAESTVALSLAALGYQVTALDPRGYVLSHPNLKVSVNGLEDLPPVQAYDAVVCLSTIEHLGIGSYALAEGADLDLVALQRAREVLKPGGRLVLTTPCASIPRVDDLQRVYDLAGLDRLMDGWVVLERRFLVQHDRRTWVASSDIPEGTTTAAALIVAQPAAS